MKEILDKIEQMHAGKDYYVHCCKSCKYRTVRFCGEEFPCGVLESNSQYECCLVKQWLETRDKVTIRFNEETDIIEMVDEFRDKIQYDAIMNTPYKYLARKEVEDYEQGLWDMYHKITGE